MAAALFLTSCGGDDEDPEVQQPTVELSSTSPISGDATVSPTEQITFKVDLRQGGAKLETFTVRQGPSSTTPVAPNPNTYTITDLDGKNIETELDGNYDINSNAVYTITFNALGNTGTYNFVFGLTDKDAVSANALEVTITVASTFKVWNDEKLNGNNPTGDIPGQFFSSLTGFNGGSKAWIGDNNPANIDITFESTGSMAKFYSPTTKPNKGTPPLTGLTVTKYAVSNLNFETVTKAELMAATAPTSLDIDVISGTTYLIENAAGKRGLIKVTSLTNVGDDARVTYNVKVLN